MTNQFNRKFFAAFSAFLTIAFLSFGFSPAQAHDGGDGECETRECRALITSAKRATAKYHDFQAALNDGFVQLSPCIEVPGVGAMGYHFGNFSRIMNPNVDAAEPEVLLYMPNEDGEMRLVGVEYVAPAVLVPTAPTLFGQAFHFSAERNTYELHAWIWRKNPAGTFAPFNPKLRCPQTNNQ